MDDKFKDIKEGDIIFIEKKIQYGWHNHLYYFIPDKVVRLTKTQFQIESDSENLYYKKNGSRVGGSGQVFKEGDSSYSRKVYDQTEEYKEMLKKVELLSEIRSNGDKLNNSSNSLTILSSDISELEQLNSLIIKILENKNEK